MAFVLSRGEGAGLLALLLTAAILFLFVQMRLFAAQQQYSSRLAVAVEQESTCTVQLRNLVDQHSSCQGRISALEEEKRDLEIRIAQLSTLQGRKFEKDVQSPVVAAVVVMACNRADYLKRTISSILQYHDKLASKFPLFISQDGNDADVQATATSFPQFTYLQHSVVRHHQVRREELVAYYKIADHYKWALGQLFNEHNYSKVIILEDDMLIAPDFFDYFEATANLLEQDDSLMAVSSWNDNGQRSFVQDAETLYRADFFPGLGWMLTKDLWDELSPKWPSAYWDDWLRLGEIRRGRQVIRPEICRTYNFGEVGSSLGQFFRQYLAPIKLNDSPVNWTSKDLRYLLQNSYAKHFALLLEKAVPVASVEEAGNVDGDVRIEYHSQTHFEVLAKEFGIFPEWKDGVPRTAYRGVVVFRWQTNRRVFLTASDSMARISMDLEGGQV